ncbi:MAG: amidohydrolase family protein [Candidatus Nomurabacteria bacterium]|jgi:adenine deaminase|nr:amidohydrolase family protein [Candidatus Nomurabacteria bacterium]
MSKYVSLAERFQQEYISIAPTLLKAARGEEVCDLVINNARIVNVLSHEIIPGNIWIKSGYIVHIDYWPNRPELVPLAPMYAEYEYNANGKLALPGFADAHMHVESTMLTPASLGRVLAKCGTTAIFTDPHEIVNVAGEEALQYMICNSDNSPIRQFLLVPSSVPAVPGLENAGADWGAGTIGQMLDLSTDSKNRVVGLAEAMQYLDIIAGNQRATNITAAARERGAFMQGHIFSAFGRDLSVYLLEGMTTNHEVLTADDVMHSIRNGERVDVRLASSLIHKEARHIVEALVKCDQFGNMSETCTDDVHVADLLDPEMGHVNHTVQQLIKYGDDPIVAVKRASLSVWQSYGVDRIGAIAPGYVADIQISDDIGHKPTHVMVNGKFAVVDGELVEEAEQRSFAFEDINTVNRNPLKPADFSIVTSDDKKRVNVITAGETLTGMIQIKLKTSQFWKDESLVAIKVFNRYGLPNVGTGLMTGYPLLGGAIASTVSHDSHNLTVVYADEEAAAKAANALIECGGGIAYVSPAGKLTVLPLPVGGLMSSGQPEIVSKQFQALERAYQADNPGANPMNIVIMALPVVPGYRVSDVGIVDVLNRKIVPLFE